MKNHKVADHCIAKPKDLHPEPNREDEPALKRTKIDMEEPEPSPGFGGSTTNHQNASKQNSGEFQDIPTYRRDSDDE